MKYLNSSERGFTLLLAALIASTVLSLGSSIFLIAQKQVLLSSAGRDSQFAFYAADAGAECALYWDMRQDAFATSSTATPSCDGVAATETVISGDRTAGPPYAIEFKLDMYASSGSARCVDVTVTKATSDPHTVIHADGYSTSCASVSLSPRALQRTVELYY
jgi:Tfp pilus assembly protein PilX